MIREKRRYILIEASEPLDMDSGRHEFERDLHSALMAELGGIHYFAANPKFVLKLGSTAFIMKCSLIGFSDTVRAFAMIRSVGGRELGFYTLKSSGTIRALKASAPIGTGSNKS